MILKSPGGSIYPYYYKGGALHCLKYGSFREDSEALFELMRAEEGFIKMQHKRLPIWVDFYETQLTKNVRSEFIYNIERLKLNIHKLAIVGSYPTRKKIKIAFGKSEQTFPFMIRYFSDPEVAKTWLVSD